MCLHLASNPGIKTEVQSYYKERLNIVERVNLKINLIPEVPVAPS